MKKLYEHLQPYKFRMTVFALLCGATLLSLILFRVRTILSGSHGLRLFDLEYFPRVDPAWAGVYRFGLRLEAQVFVFHRAACGDPLDAFLSQRALHPDRFTTSRLSQTRCAALV